MDVDAIREDKGVQDCLDEITHATVVRKVEDVLAALHREGKEPTKSQLRRIDQALKSKSKKRLLKVLTEIRCAGGVLKLIDIAAEQANLMGPPDPRDSARDKNVSPGDMSPEAQETRATASKACANCPGYCCLVFSLRTSKTGMRKQLRDLRKTLKETTEARDRYIYMHVLRDLPVKLDTLEMYDRMLRVSRNDIFNCEFFSKNLIPLKVTGHLKHTPKYELDPRSGKRRDSRSFMKDHYYSCKAFDKEARRCTAYENRPPTCKMYHCGPATVGMVPEAGKMYAGSGCFPERAEYAVKQEAAINGVPSHGEVVKAVAVS